MRELIKKLVETTAPSGNEGEIREVISQLISDYADDISVDALGNLIARKGKKSNDGQCIMLAAHMDEIGVMVTHVDDSGFVRFTSVGGVYPKNCVGGRVRFINGTQGVINTELVDSVLKVPPLDKMFIDVGARDKESCPVKIGDVAAFERPFVDLGERMVSKAMDDRIGVAVLIEVLRQIKSAPNEIYFVFSVQEEVGTRGAVTAAYGINPDIGIAVDVTTTGDTPKGIKMDVALGKGPAIKVRDRGMISDPRLVSWMADIAAKADIPYQLEILEGGTTDARAIQITRAGVPSSCVSVPTRYVHSPSEMVDYSDVVNSVSLLKELLGQPIKLR